MKLWIKVIAGVVPGALILLLSIILFLYCRRRRRRRLITTTPFAESAAKFKNDSFPSSLAKLHLSYKSSLRFHNLHHQSQQPPPPSIPHQSLPFNWDDHPQLITEAAEYGWSRFVFTGSSAAPRATTPLLGFCDGGGRQQQDSAEIEWELPAGSPEFMQTVRVMPANNSLSMSLPLPGPQLGGGRGAFPQEAYFEITILVLQSQQQQRASKASRRGKEGKGVRTKLIQENPLIQSSTLRRDPQFGEEGEGGKDDCVVVSVGFAVWGISSNRLLMMPGTYLGSIGFNSNGSVHLDGRKLVFESERAEWGGVNRVIGCGFNPSKKKVFLTVDSELVHVINCSSDVYMSPLYPMLAAAKAADAMFLVNLGQKAFKYAPANAQRTANPCFVRSPSNDGIAAAANLGFMDSRELFSMRRIESECFDIKKNDDSYNGGRIAEDVDPDSELFEISLQR